LATSQRQGYLLSGAVGSLAALSLNRALEIRN
jgi:hypothetical protein